MGQPKENTMINALGSKASNGTIASIDMIGSTEKISWKQEAGALVIKPSKAYPSENAIVYKIDFKN